MLNPRQIKKMARPYTDKQIYRQVGRLKVGTDFWANGEIAFYEDLPAKFDRERDYIVDATEADAAYLSDICQKAIVPVYPVELKGTVYGNIYLRFSDGNGGSWWANAHYVATGLKKAGRKKADLAFFMATHGKHNNLVLRRNGQSLMLLACCELDEGTGWEWKLVNNEAPA